MKKIIDFFKKLFGKEKNEPKTSPVPVPSVQSPPARVRQQLKPPRRILYVEARQINTTFGFCTLVEIDEERERFIKITKSQIAEIIDPEEWLMGLKLGEYFVILLPLVEEDFISGVYFLDSEGVEEQVDTESGQRMLKIPLLQYMPIVLLSNEIIQEVERLNGKHRLPVSEKTGGEWKLKVYWPEDGELSLSIQKVKKSEKEEGLVILQTEEKIYLLSKNHPANLVDRNPKFLSLNFKEMKGVEILGNEEFSGKWWLTPFAR